MDSHSISSLKLAAISGRVEARVPGQIEAVARKETREGKPFFEMTLTDGEAKLTLRAWSDGPAFGACERLAVGDFVAISGEFAWNGSFGVESKRWTCQPLEADERAALLAGSPEISARQAIDFNDINIAVESIGDPRLGALAKLFLAEYGERFRRTAAARNNHHARRGGLVEHVAQMLRAAVALAQVYPQLNRDLLVTAVLFHDAGKLWENSLPADGFIMPFDERGELLGHIAIGIELVNALWRKLLAGPEASAWNEFDPPNEDVRLHLLHLIAAHHGELQFGSPVVPRTPEAWALHYVDNLDAKLEMLATAYRGARRIAPRIYEKAWPLAGHPVEPLARFEPGSGDPAAGVNP